jgi:hypothetical protein
MSRTEVWAPIATRTPGDLAWEVWPAAPIGLNEMRVLVAAGLAETRELCVRNLTMLQVRAMPSRLTPDEMRLGETETRLRLPDQIEGVPGEFVSQSTPPAVDEP